jgi:hypothetical protein
MEGRGTHKFGIVKSAPHNQHTHDLAQQLHLDLLCYLFHLIRSLTLAAAHGPGSAWALGLKTTSVVCRQRYCVWFAANSMVFGGG